MYQYIYIYTYACVCVYVYTPAVGTFPGTELQAAQLAPDHLLDAVVAVAAVALDGLGLGSPPGT